MWAGKGAAYIVYRTLKISALWCIFAGTWLVLVLYSWFEKANYSATKKVNGEEKRKSGFRVRGHSQS